MKPPFNDSRRGVDLHIPPRTYLSFAAAFAIAYVLWVLMPLMMLLLPALLLATTVDPLLAWMRRKGIPRWLGVLGIAALFAAAAVFFVVIILPPLIAQISVLFQKLPEMPRKIVHYFPEGSPLRAFSSKAFSQLKAPDPASWLNHAVIAVELAAGGLTGAFLIVVFTLYLLMDGGRTYLWLAAFLSEEHREKLDQTSAEVAHVVFAYVAGQVITSLICGVYTFFVLAALGVPAALALGILAGVCDVLPVVGLFISMIPSLLLALSVSPAKALLVFVAYAVYHAVENYLLVPKVYGNRLRLSDLVVIVSLLVGGTVAGVMGAIMVLPLVACYPIIERIWLAKSLGSSVIREHEASGSRHGKASAG
jgi:predicted PurR-regulated permease PerM